MLLGSLCLTAALTGCGSERGDTHTSVQSQDFKQEARQTIDAENMDQFLQQLEAEIAADEAAVR
jgi:hypothetical protein